MAHKAAKQARARTQTRHTSENASPPLTDSWSRPGAWCSCRLQEGCCRRSAVDGACSRGAAALRSPALPPLTAAATRPCSRASPAGPRKGASTSLQYEKGSTFQRDDRCGFYRARLRSRRGPRGTVRPRCSTDNVAVPPRLRMGIHHDYQIVSHFSFSYRLNERLPMGNELASRIHSELSPITPRSVSAVPR